MRVAERVTVELAENRCYTEWVATKSLELLRTSARKRQGRADDKVKANKPHVSPIEKRAGTLAGNQRLPSEHRFLPPTTSSVFPFSISYLRNSAALSELLTLLVRIDCKDVAVAHGFSTFLLQGGAERVRVCDRKGKEKDN